MDTQIKNQDQKQDKDLDFKPDMNKPDMNQANTNPQQQQNQKPEASMPTQNSDLDTRASNDDQKVSNEKVPNKSEAA